ncbi:MAG TPA: hypothetical protein VMT87_10730, partial [Vicinamibacteria bacterium]|nr:hypothetical protein [Vicinamibacteria bacterium]
EGSTCGAAISIHSSESRHGTPIVSARAKSARIVLQAGLWPGLRELERTDSDRNEDCNDAFAPGGRGGSFLQAVDAASCGAGNVARIP